MTAILKLGGSVVTIKDEPETVDDDRLGAAASDVATALDGDGPGELVVVHGGGSFGHHHADARGVSTTEGTRSAVGVREIHGAMTELNRTVVGALADRGVEALPVHPLSVATRTDGGRLQLPARAVETMLGEGFVPVLHGDVVGHEGEGATVLSGDEIVVSLARSLDADSVGLCSTVPGVLDADGTVVESIRTFEEVADALGDSGTTDVTGGMAGKVRTLLDLDTPASIFDPSGVAAFLRGDSPGTLVAGE